MKLQGRNALVTGSAQGIGQAIALKLAEEGADVVINYRKSREGAEETGNRIRAMGRRCAVIQADVGKIGEARRLVEEATAALGLLDVLVNNAGIEKRAATLKSLASPEKRAEIDSAVKRLLGDGRTEMGKLFKALGIAHPSIGKLPGFEPETFF